MTVVLFKSQDDDPNLWKSELERYLPELDFRIWPNLGAAEDIEFLMIWEQLDDVLGALPNLKVILSMGAGVDHLGDLKKIPKNITVTRLIDKDLTQGMSEYILLNILRFHRFDTIYRDQQAEKIWRAHPPISASEICVGIMGLGILGVDAAKKLKSLDYEVLGWTRTPKSIEVCPVLHGKRNLKEFLGRTNILVCLLPLTAETEGILCKETFSRLPTNSYLVNAGRGRHLVDGDLIEALETGQLGGAAIDVFEKEPLPKTHPFWVNDKILITPHAASITNYKTAAKSIAANIQNWQTGGNVVGLIDPKQGY